MDIVRRIICITTSFALAITFVGLGFFACVAPPTTQMLSNEVSDDKTSPFSRSDLSRVASATRDYSFGAHDEASLLKTIYEVDLAYQRSLEEKGGQVPTDFPNLSVVSNPDDPQQLKAAFAGASEMYCYSSETISHLDDCYRLSSLAYRLLAVCAAIAVIGLVVVGIRYKARIVGRTLMWAGGKVVVFCIGLGIWAFVDFTSFFAAFHRLFFGQGNWTFPSDSLLICALPTAFWAGMGIVWLVVSVILALISIGIGSRMRKKNGASRTRQ